VVAACCTTVVFLLLWMRSAFHADSVRWISSTREHCFTAASGNGKVQLGYSRIPPAYLKAQPMAGYDPGWRRFSYSFADYGTRTGINVPSTYLGFHLFSASIPLSGPFNRYHLSIVIPAWFLVSCSVAIVALVVSRVRRSARIREGCCPNCQYDLRATPDRCPECGTVFRGNPWVTALVEDPKGKDSGSAAG
jgi:hypothetical protein